MHGPIRDDQRREGRGEGGKGRGGEEGGGWLAKGVHGISIARRNNWVQSGRLPYVTSAPFKPRRGEMLHLSLAPLSLLLVLLAGLRAAPAKRSPRPSREKESRRTVSDYWRASVREEEEEEGEGEDAGAASMEELEAEDEEEEGGRWKMIREREKVG